MHPARENDMRHTRKAVRVEYKHFKKESRINQNSEPFFKILDKKLKGKPLRAYFLTKAYYYLSAKYKIKANLPEEFFTHKLPFIAEVIISIQYYHNQIIDGKGGVDNLDKASINMLKANLLKDTLFVYLESATEDESVNNYLHKAISEIFRQVDTGQLIERYCGVYEVWGIKEETRHLFEEIVDPFIDSNIIEQIMDCVKKAKCFKASELVFIEKYIERIYLTNGALYIMLTRVIMKLLSIDKDCNFIRFVTLFAIMHQIVNDNGDLVPSSFNLSTEVKEPSDAFSDLRTATMTIPLCIHLKRRPNGGIANYLLKPGEKLNEDQEQLFFNELIASHSIYYSMNLGKALRREAINLLDAQNPQYLWMEDMCKVAGNNKYYKCFYDRNEEYKAYRRERPFIF